MARISQGLNPGELQSLPEGEHCDGGGLYLRVTGMGGRSWIVKYQWAKKQEKMGIGSLADVAMKDARKKAKAIRDQARDGINPKIHREQVSASARSAPLFKDFAKDIVTARVAGMKNDKGIAKWWRSVNVYCVDLHAKQMHEITVDDVVAVLKPRWIKNPQAMRNCRAHLQEIFGAARAKKIIPKNETNPAVWADNLKFLLGKQPRKGKVRGSHPAMKYADVPAFMAELRAKDTVGALMLETLILTGVRTTEAIQMRWNQIDLAQSRWVIPGKIMKNGLEADIPLTDTVIALLKRIKEIGLGGPNVFPGQKAGTACSNNTMLKLLKVDLGRSNVTVHGFRSSFRTWGQNETPLVDAKGKPTVAIAREVLELCLHHIEGSEAENAYAKGDMWEKRRVALKAWETFCNSKTAPKLQLVA
jgi:integrase